MQVTTKRKPGTLKIYIDPQSDCTLKIKAYCTQKQANVYLDSVFELQAGKQELSIPFPLAPKKMEVEFESAQQIPFLGIEYVDGVRILPYKFNPDLFQFIDGVLTFSENASYNRQGLYSDLKLDYADKVRDSKKQEIPTPARTHVPTGKIIVGKDIFKTFTIPQRVFTLLHERGHYEYRHLYDPNSEESRREHERLADEFAINIFMALGFPETEADSVMKKIIPNESYRDSRDKMIDLQTNALEKLRGLQTYRTKWQQQ